MRIRWVGQGLAHCRLVPLSSIWQPLLRCCSGRWSCALAALLESSPVLMRPVSLRLTEVVKDAGKD